MKFIKDDLLSNESYSDIVIKDVNKQSTALKTECSLDAKSYEELE